MIDVDKYLPISNDSLDLFKTVFLAYGARGGRDPNAYSKASKLNDLEKMKIVPLVFQLLPREAIDPNSGRQLSEPIKPIIMKHLVSIGLQKDDKDLVDILKTVSDQYYQCALAKVDKSKVAMRKKASIATLMANQPLYKKKLGEQNKRCPVCGSELTESGKDTLDHVLPYSLLGDISDGANWQIMCRECNTGKGDFLSAFQAKEAFNWIYPSVDTTNPSPATRYASLCINPICSEEECSATSATRSLRVIVENVSGLAVYSNLRVRCELH